MKHEWRKHEKSLYLPGNKPVRIHIPEMKFFTIKGQGNPNDDSFPEYIKVLYSISYAVKMSPKKGLTPEGYKVHFETIPEGDCIQMLHLGPYDDERNSFDRMECYAAEQKLKHSSKTHREIYLTDARKTPPEKLKTVLRFQVVKGG